jgi:hypothetical protein
VFDPAGHPFGVFGDVDRLLCGSMNAFASTSYDPSHPSYYCRLCDRIDQKTDVVDCSSFVCDWMTLSACFSCDSMKIAGWRSDLHADRNADFARDQRRILLSASLRAVLLVFYMLFGLTYFTIPNIKETSATLYRYACLRLHCSMDISS